MSKLSKFPKLKRKTKYFLAGLISFILFICLSIQPSIARNTHQIHILDNEPQQLSSPAPSVFPSPTGVNLNNPEEFAAFTNNFFEQQLVEDKIPGAVISVVKDGKLFFTNGYGYANLENNIPVSADKTIFRVASLAKLFTATAAMQLYERGKLNLDTDVNEYLDNLDNWQIKNPYAEPVTPAKMMMHTDGTTQRLIGLGEQTRAQMQPLGAYLPEYMPPITYSPGKFYSYSNHSIALLGYLVEKLSGVDFPEYIEKNIFQPLAMKNSTFVQPPSLEVSDNLAVGYQIQSGKAQPVPYLYLNIAPAAALQTTATDMAKFMLAHLQDGSYQNSQILQPETTKLMHQTHYQIHPLLPGTSYGFRERLINNKRAIGHLGSLRGYSSILMLVPEENIGIFIATNSFSNIHGKFINKFFDRYFPTESNSFNSTTFDAVQISSEQLEKYTGTYRDMEYPKSSIAKITGVAKQIQVTTQSDGTLLVQTPKLFFRKKVDDVKLIPTAEPGLFYRENDNAYVYFVENQSGEITHLSNPLYPKIGTYKRVSWYKNIRLHLGLLAFCVICFISATFMGIIHPLVRILLGVKTKAEYEYQKKQDLSKLILTRTIAGLIGILNLIFLIGLPLYLWWWGAWKLVYGVPPVVVGFLSLPILTTILSLILVILMLVVWQKNYWSWKRRSPETLITIAGVIFIPLLAYWNLLGWQF